MPGAIDIVINLHTPDVLPLKPKWRREFIGDKMAADAESRRAIACFIRRRDRREASDGR